jgi:hypothetical protein
MNAFWICMIFMAAVDLMVLRGTVQEYTEAPPFARRRGGRPLTPNRMPRSRTRAPSTSPASAAVPNR